MWQEPNPWLPSLRFVCESQETLEKKSSGLKLPDMPLNSRIQLKQKGSHSKLAETTGLSSHHSDHCDL